MERRIRIPTNLAAGLCFMLAGVALWLIIPWQIRFPAAVDRGINAQSIPRIIAVIAFVVGLYLVFKSLFLKREDVHEIVLEDEARRGLFLGMLLVYAFAIDYIGFLIGSSLFVCAFQWLFGARKWSYCLIVLACTVGVYLAFRYVLGVGFTSLTGV